MTQASVSGVHIKPKGQDEDDDISVLEYVSLFPDQYDSETKQKLSNTALKVANFSQ